MEAPKFNIEFTQEQRAKIEKAMELIGLRATLQTIAEGMDEAAALTVSDIQQKRLTGQGPFPVEEGRLGVRTNRLRASIRATKASFAAVNGDTGIATVSIGSNVKYAAIHEFGGVINRETKPGKVRLRTDKSGNLLRQPSNGSLAVFAKKTHKQAREVGYAGGKKYQIKIPARAPFGHGIADNLPRFTRIIARKITEKLSAA